MDGISSIFEAVGNIESVLYYIDDFARGLLLLSIVPLLLNCFFGYKIQKFMITLGGVVVGAILGGVVGAFSRETAVTILAVIILAVLCGFVAFKLYKFGIFMQFWLLGTVFFAAIFFISGFTQGVGMAAILGLIVGVLALVLYKGFIILTTAISGGMSAGIAIGSAIRSSGAGILIGVILSVFGATVQFLLEKKKDNIENVPDFNAVQNQKPTDYQGVCNVSQNDIKTETNNSRTILYTATPDVFCPKAKVLIDLITLSKDANGNMSIKIDFNNIGDRNILAVYFKVIGFDIAGEILGEQVYSVIDINVAPNTKFNTDEIELFDKQVRRINVIITQIVSDNFEVTKIENNDIIKIPESTPIMSVVNEDTSELLNLLPDEKYLFKPLDEDMWLCTCGHIGYHKCSYCGRTAEESLKETDVLKRISENVYRLISDIDKCNSIKELDVCKEKVERIATILSGNELSQDLLNECRSALEKINLKKYEINQKNTIVKAKRRKIACIAGSCLVAIMILVVAVKVIIGLPPSNRRIKADTEKFFLNTFGESYTIQDIDIEKPEDDKYTFANVEAINEQNNDILQLTVRLWYSKVKGRYVNKEIECIDGSKLLPNHKISKHDIFELPAISLNIGDEWITLYSDSEADVTFEVDYSNVVVDNGEGNVPISLHIDYLNATVDATSTLKYTYKGNNHWECDESLSLKTEPKNKFLDNALLKELVSEASIYYKGELLSCEFLTLGDYEVNYSEAFTRIELTGEATWDNSIVKLDGKCIAEFEQKDDSWALLSFRFQNGTKMTRYSEIEDSEIMALISDVIQNQCNEKTNVSNVRIIEKDKDDKGIVVNVQYNSEKGIYLLSNEITVKFTETVLSGYIFNEVILGAIETTGLIEEIHKDIDVNYSLVSSDDVYPVNMPTSGTAVMHLDINQNGNTVVYGNIGSIYVYFSGNIIYETNDLALCNTEKEVYVQYVLIFRSKTNISFNVYPDLSYIDNKLSGVINFKSIAIGVGDFSLHIN